MNKGATLKKLIESKGLNIGMVADRASVTRSTLYNWFKEEELRFDKAKKILDVIGYPDYNKVDFELLCVEEEQAEYEIMAKPISEFKKKYYSLLERHVEVQEQLIELREQLAEARAKIAPNSSDIDKKSK